MIDESVPAEQTKHDDDDDDSTNDVQDRGHGRNLLRHPAEARCVPLLASRRAIRRHTRDTATRDRLRRVGVRTRPSTLSVHRPASLRIDLRNRLTDRVDDSPGADYDSTPALPSSTPAPREGATSDGPAPERPRSEGAWLVQSGRRLQSSRGPGVASAGPSPRRWQPMASTSPWSTWTARRLPRLPAPSPSRAAPRRLGSRPTSAS